MQPNRQRKNKTIKKTKKLISIRLDPKMIADIKETGEGITEFIEKAANSRLRWLIAKKKTEEAEKFWDPEIEAVIKAAKEKWKEDDH